MCLGAEGCLYMFHKIVLTPQKMKRVQYQQIREFWRGLGELMSKVDHEDTAVHLLGGQLQNPQGKELLYEIQKAMLPNLVTVHWVGEEEGGSGRDGGREVVELYFDFRKFLLWRAKHDSSHGLDYTDITRSWSSLADEADDLDFRY
ncbi:NMDA receptor synaptonuclear signaling and neuronal migration factor-like [Babylonia areolata]|uniref:NMDA receptor synaptonuclear signaling and neuronal migration factor-like n=1 Tax=Babylonia areolata TaxID=304850 RepID=UPI003FD13735